MTLKQLRESANLRQVDVAKKLNIDQTAVSNWECGKTRPAKKYRKKLAKMYMLPLDDLNFLVENAKEA